MLQRGYLEILEATDDPALRFKTLQAFLHMMADNFTSKSVPADVGTMREQLIKKITGNLDPFAEKKRMSNQEALKLLFFAEKLVITEHEAEKRFRKACLVAIVGNIIEFNIPGHEFKFDDIARLIQESEKDLVVDDISEAYNIAQKANLIIYLTDNAGEIAFDTLLVKELRNIAKDGHVVVAVKGKSFYNDATLEDALLVGMDKEADMLITMGDGAMGLLPSQCSEEFLSLYDKADFVVAKGMGYAETLTEFDLKVLHLLLLRTKCMNIANYFHVPREKNIAKLI